MFKLNTKLKKVMMFIVSSFIIFTLFFNSLASLNIIHITPNFNSFSKSELDQRVLKSNEKMDTKNMILPIILTIRGTKLADFEKEFIKKLNPFGFMFHCSNMQSVELTKQIITEIKQTLNRDNVYFMIDQEGGRVDRLKCVYDKKYESQLYFGQIAKTNLSLAEKLVYENAENAAKQMKNIGFNFNLAPVLDVLRDNANISESSDYISSINTKEDIGDRAFSHNPKIVAALGKQVIKAMNNNNIETSIKHMPGLGSSTVNSHYNLPVINKAKKDLIAEDFYPFKQLNYNKYALVAHAKYTNIDNKNISTFSSKLVKTIRDEIGFKGFLITDALNMKALGDGDVYSKVTKAFNAGYDIVMPYYTITTMKEYNKLVESIPIESIINFNLKYQNNYHQ